MPSKHQVSTRRLGKTNIEVTPIGLGMMEFAGGGVIAAIFHHGRVILPRGTSTFRAEDEVLAITDQEGVRFLAEHFARPVEAGGTPPNPKPA